MATGEKPKYRFTRLVLENWRNFKRVDLPVAQRMFLVGPNACGKSNLLDVFRFLRDVASSGGLQKAVADRGGVSSVRCLAARMYSDIRVQVTVGSNGGGPVWEYELRFSQDNRRRPIVKRETVSKDGRSVLTRPDEQDTSDPERLTQTHLEQVSANRDFRELADFFGSVRYRHIVPQLVRQPQRFVGPRDDPYGGDFLEQVASADKRIQGARLRRIQEALRVAVPQLSELKLERDEQGAPHLRGKYDHWRPRGAWQGEETFSDGTLRLMALLWTLQEGSGPLLLEEPELSLHPAVVRLIPQMLARIGRRTGRQVMVSTHSSDLLQDDGIGIDEVCLLQPTPEGTEAQSAASIQEVKTLLDNGLSMADAVIPRTQPRATDQLLMSFMD